MGKAYTSAELLAPAKLNLRLKVLGRRADGYHQLSMINSAVSLADRIVVQLHSEPFFEVSELSFGRAFKSESLDGLKGELCDPDKNLLLKAAKNFYEKFGIRGGVTVKLHKEIPAGAGLGGGSSDAAAILGLLRERFMPDLSDRGLIELALSLGADVPYFIRPVPALVGGVGELMTPLDNKLKQELRGYPLFLIVPPFQLSTVEVYKKYRELHPNIEPYADQIGQAARCGTLELAQLFDGVENDLFAACLKIEPRIGQVLERIRHALPGFQVGMSGSGSALFAIPRERTSLKPLAEIEKVANDCETFDLFMTVD